MNLGVARGRGLIARTMCRARHWDPPGKGVQRLDPARIRVQVKCRQAAAEASEVLQLAGTLHGPERGLFVSLGGFQQQAYGVMASVSLMDGAPAYISPEPYHHSVARPVFWQMHRREHDARVLAENAL